MAKNTPKTGMTLRRETPGDLLTVESYGDNGFKFKGRRFGGSVLVTPEGIHPVAAKTAAELKPEHIEKLLGAELKPELVLVGTGPRMELLPREFKDALNGAGIGFDPMDTGAAARTYNVLLFEDRRVAALLLAVR